MTSQHQPSPENIALAPELAVLHVLDAALAMTVETLTAAHCDLDHPTCPEERLAGIIANQASMLRNTISSYARATTSHHIRLTKP
jgi:hypothetical protein